MTQTIMNNGRVTLHAGDSRDVLRTIPDNSIDSIVTDPPYALVSVVKRFGGANAAAAQHGTDGLYARASAGFMGKQWDNGEVAFAAEFWAECLRVLKPGGHVLAFGGTRTQHRLVCAIEDAGFEIRDQIGWLYGSGFPKSHNQKGDWEGWGTALKPAWESICVARKPIEWSNAANLAKWGVGCLNIEGCRVPIDANVDVSQLRTMQRSERANEDGWGMGATDSAAVLHVEGRWPANIIHDGSREVIEAFPDAAGQMAKAATGTERRKDQNVYGTMTRGTIAAAPRIETDKSAARFFYAAKASKKDRDEGLDHLPKASGGMLSETSGQHITRRDEGYQPEPRANSHPTVKPTDLMRYLCRLVTPPNGVVLDPFMGSGSTGKAAVLEGFRFIGIEREEEYMPIAEGRIAWAVLRAAGDVVDVDPAPANDNDNQDTANAAA